MSTTLTVHPHKVITWEEYLKTAKFGMALDGFVSGGPMFSSVGPHVNFNHHENCDRLCTRATCAQVLLAIRQGLFKRFASTDIHVDVNDCDEDVCTAWFLLKNHHLVVSAMNPILNRLVALEDMLDATAGAYPYPADLPVLEEMAWVFEPYRLFRLSGQLDKSDDPKEFKSIITDVESRIMRHVTGQGQKIQINTEYEILRAEKKWTMVREIGGSARTGMFADGISSYVSVRQQHGSCWSYTIGRLSPFIPFEMNKLYDTLNATEGLADLPQEKKWGGSNIVGGSPRVNGSKLSPDELAKIINETIENKE